jgi:phosphoglycolate phosphatase
MNKGLIIFDLDGTLTDSCPGILKSIEYAVTRSGRPVPDEAVLKSFIGPPLLGHFQSALGMSEEEAEKAVVFFRERYNKTGIFENSVFDGVEELVGRLKKDGYAVSVATSKPVSAAKVVLEYFDIEKYFENWQGSTGDKGRSDKMDIIERVIDENGFSKEKEKVFLVGDRKYDAMGAVACNIGFFGAGWGYAPEGELEGYPNLGIASTPKELYKMISERLDK